MFLCGNISADDYARELFKPSKDSASPHICNEKKFLVLGFRFFECRHKWSCFRPFWLTSSGLRPKPLDGSISLEVIMGN